MSSEGGHNHNFALSITLEDAIEAKKRAERKIAEALQEFSFKTFLHPDSIDISSVGTRDVGGRTREVFINGVTIHCFLKL